MNGANTKLSTVIQIKCDFTHQLNFFIFSIANQNFKKFQGCLPYLLVNAR